MNNYTSEQLEEEAQRILQKIKVFDPSSKWQYRDALQLIHIGVILKNDFYMMRGKNFYNLCCMHIKIENNQIYGPERAG